jgi:hypothetical protein
MAFGALFMLGLFLLAMGCGGGDGDSHAVHLYNAYRTAEDQRDDAESQLRQSFSDISAAAQAEDRQAVLDAAHQGQRAAEESDRLIAAELEAAEGLSEIDQVSADGKRLAEGLRQTRQSLALTKQELTIALADPFLLERADEVQSLARRSTRLAVQGELGIRRADRAIAVALGLEPRPDEAVTTG